MHIKFQVNFAVWTLQNEFFVNVDITKIDVTKKIEDDKKKLNYLKFFYLSTEKQKWAVLQKMSGL